MASIIVDDLIIQHRYWNLFKYYLATLHAISYNNPAFPHQILQGYSTSKLLPLVSGNANTTIAAKTENAETVTRADP
jgi:hypothetical protein